MPNHLGTVGAKDVKVHPWLVETLELTVLVPTGLGQSVHVVLAAIYYKRQHRHDTRGPDFHDPKGDNWRGQEPHL